MIYQAEAEGLKRLNQAGINETVLKLKGIEAMKDIADGQATKIFVPSDLAGVVSGLGMVGETLGIGDATPIKHEFKAKPVLVEDPCLKEDASHVSRQAARRMSDIHRSVGDDVVENR